MTRFFVEPEELASEQVRLTGENFQHARVLRLKQEEKLLLCDGEGREALCAVQEVGTQDITLSVLERRESAAEARVRVSVYMAFPKADNCLYVNSGR